MQHGDAGWEKHCWLRRSRLRVHAAARICVWKCVRTMRSAIRLYERRGYRRFAARRGYYEDGGDAWRYEKELGLKTEG